MPEVSAPRAFKNRAAFRAWLAKHHATRTELWLLLAKKHVPGPVLSYDEAVEEALCFGWIDGIMKRHDEDYRVIRMSPRKPRSIWAESNKRRVAKLIRQRKMTPAGLALVEHAKRNGAWSAVRARRENLEPPPELVRALSKSKRARDYFAGVPPGYRRMVLEWIDSAKKPETRVVRAERLAKACAEAKRLF
jgi:uncharacterized protein YdeI (YjbR/CyaY-like superfamily)